MRIHHQFLLLGEVDFDIPLHSTEEEGPEDLVQFAHHPLPMLLMDDVIHGRVLPNVLEAEPRAKHAQVVEYVGLAEIEERPELL